MANAPRRLAAGLLLAALAVCAAAAGAQARPAADPVLAATALRPAQVGSGYHVVQRKDGHGVSGMVTLDLCGFVFPSETARTDRLQIDYERNARAITYSNEVVVYKAGKAAQAISEVKYASKHCPAKPVVSPYYGGTAIKYVVSPLPGAGLRPGSVALQIHVSANVNGKRVQQLVVAVYQVRGDLLSGVYAYPAKGTSLAELRKAAFHAAEAAALNLAPVA